MSWRHPGRWKGRSGLRRARLSFGALHEAAPRLKGRPSPDRPFPLLLSHRRAASAPQTLPRAPVRPGERRETQLLPRGRRRRAASAAAGCQRLVAGAAGPPAGRGRAAGLAPPLGRPPRPAAPPTVLDRRLRGQLCRAEDRSAGRRPRQAGGRAPRAKLARGTGQLPRRGYHSCYSGSGAFRSSCQPQPAVRAPV